MLRRLARRVVGVGRSVVNRVRGLLGRGRSSQTTDTSI